MLYSIKQFIKRLWRYICNIVATTCIFTVLIIAAEYIVWDKMPLPLHLPLAIVLITGYILGLIGGFNIAEWYFQQE